MWRSAGASSVGQPVPARCESQNSTRNHSDWVLQYGQFLWLQAIVAAARVVRAGLVGMALCCAWALQRFQLGRGSQQQAQEVVAHVARVRGFHAARVVLRPGAVVAHAASMLSPCCACRAALRGAACCGSSTHIARAAYQAPHACVWRQEARTAALHVACIVAR